MHGRLDLLSTGIGSFPFNSVEEAIDLVISSLDIPHWPQLPRRKKDEDMISQFLDGMPGVIAEDGEIFLDPFNPSDEWEGFYRALEEGDLDRFGISRDRAEGLFRFLSIPGTFPIVKGQVTGPVTLGLSLKKKDGVFAIYDDILRDMLVKFVSMKARWEVRELSKKGKKVIIFLDEPTLSGYGSVYMNLSKGDVLEIINGALEGINAIKGIHICGNTDWTMVMEMNIDILNFDAYNFLDSFLIYSDEIKDFVKKGGRIAWGIIPTDDEAIEKVSLKDIMPMVDKIVGVLGEDNFKKSLLTPSCGVGSMSVDGAKKVYGMLKDLTQTLRREFGV